MHRRCLAAFVVHTLLGCNLVTKVGDLGFGGAGAGGSARSSASSGSTTPGCATAWALSLGNQGEIKLADAAAGGDGGIYVVATVNGSVSLGDVTVRETVGGSGTLLAKFDDAGDNVWIRALPEQPTDGGAYAITSSHISGDRLMLVATYSGPLTYDGEALSGLSGIPRGFVAAHDTATGDLLSIVESSIAGEYAILDLASDGVGSVLAIIDGNADFGGGEVTGSTLVRLTESLTFLDQVQLSSAGGQLGGGRTISASSTIVHMTGDIGLGTTTVADGPELAGTFYRAELSDAFTWLRGEGYSATLGAQFGGLGTTRRLIAGHFAGSVELGGKQLFSAGSDDVVVALYDMSGGHVVSARFGDDAGQTLTRASIDGDDNTFISGASSSEVIDLGGGELRDAARFVAVFGPDGEHRCSRGFSEGVEFADFIVLPGPGRPALVATYAGTFGDGATAVTSTSARDLLVVGLKVGD